MKKAKRCSMCKKRKPVNQFSKDKRAKDGLYSCCRPCHNKKVNRYYKENREEILSRQQSYQRLHPEKRAAAREKWEKKHPEKRAEYKKRHRQKHAERIKANWAIYYAANRERVLAQKAEYREENRETIYARRDMEKHREYGRKRRALLRDAYVSAVVEDEIIQRDRGRCGICGDPVMGPLEIDHVVAIANNGTHEPANVQLTHKSCNRQKWTKDQQDCQAIQPKETK